MGEALPYTQEQLLDLVSGLTIVGIRLESDNVVFLSLDREGNDVEIEAHASLVDSEFGPQITLYVRGREL